MAQQGRASLFPHPFNLGFLENSMIWQTGSPYSAHLREVGGGVRPQGLALVCNKVG